MPENSLSPHEATSKLIAKSKSVSLPDGLLDKLDELFSQLEVNIHHEESFWSNYQLISQYLNWIIALPWSQSSQDVLDLEFAKEKLDESHYDLDPEIGRAYV